jgi:2-desacetyl-2-hydroxyethyl bacteriochlorophyllide A dehydrogenase
METVTARRVVFVAPRRVEIEEVRLAAPGRGQARVRGEWSLISAGTEMTAYRGEFPPGDSAWARYVRYPFRPGYSVVGRVEAVGEGCALNTGERIVVEGAHSSHLLVDAPSDDGGVGASSTHTPSRPLALPAAVRPEDGVFHALARVAMQGVRLAGVELGASVAVIGCGLVGQLALRLCRVAGALRVVAVDRSPARLARAQAAGADVALAADAADLAERLAAANDGRLADVVIDATGDPAAFVAATRLTRDLGRVVLLGSPRGPVTVDLHDDVHTRGLVVVGAHASTTPRQETALTPWSMERNVRLFFAFLAQGRLAVHDLVSHRFPLTAAADAYALLERDPEAALGVLLDLGR